MDEPRGDEPRDDDGLGLCWSCQAALIFSTAVWLNEHDAIQCCRECWSKITPGQRMEIALAFRDRSVEGLGVQETLQLIRDVLTTHGFHDRAVDEENRRN